jgi:hypothetical protein
VTFPEAAKLLLVRRGDGPYFIVRDRNGQALAYVYFEEEPGRRASARPPDPRIRVS